MALDTMFTTGRPEGGASRAPEGVPSVDQRQYRQAISAFPTGVSVITTLTEGRPVGMTASSVTSLSLQPVLLLACISRRLPSHDAIKSSGRFAVNVLGEGMEKVARCFATPAENKFEDIPLVRKHELPVLEWAIAHFVCTLHDCLPGGDHTIFVGEVLDCGHRAGARPLLYFRSDFGEMASADRDAELLSGTWGAYLSAHT